MIVLKSSVGNLKKGARLRLLSAHDDGTAYAWHGCGVIAVPAGQWEAA